MAEQSHYVNLIEGYPDLMSLKHSGGAITHRKCLGSPMTSENLTSEEMTESGEEGKSPDEIDEINVKLNKW